MNDTIRNLKDEYGANSPAVAEQLNSIGVELQCRGEIRTALKFHQEALTILEWNKCNALLYDFAKKSKEYAIGMANTLRRIGNLLREMNNFVGAAEVYKECLDTFLEGLIEGGGSLKRKLLECEYKKDVDSYHAVLARVDRKSIGRIMCLHPEFRATVREVAQLFNEMQCVKFVGLNAASSRRHRRMVQHAAQEANLRSAAESLSASVTIPSSEMPSLGVSDEKKSHHHQKPPSRSLSCSSITSDNESWMRCFWEKEMGRFSRPRPLARRAITDDEEYGHYTALASMIIPAEECLVVALKRFPLPKSVVGDNKYLRQCSEESVNANGGFSGYERRDLEERCSPSPPMTAELSPRCVSRPVYQTEVQDVFLKGGW